jgi:hypothetical protein
LVPPFMEELDWVGLIGLLGRMIIVE